MNGIVIYNAAALFSGRETSFNIDLTHKLEKKRYPVFLPQRDGFEAGELYAGLSKKLSQEELGHAINVIIFYLDVGYQIPISHVVVANCDEPFDVGVAIEMQFARIIGKDVIGYRTDVRSPHKYFTNPFEGMHPFPGYACNHFIYQPMLNTSIEEKDAEIQELADKIDRAIKESDISLDTTIPEYNLKNPYISKILNGAKILFEGIDDFHSEEGMKEIIERYLGNKEELLELEPRFI